ncbi:dihydropteroate synthase [Sporomusa acidovorans]|uniref:Dihydropteroate synthase n=1 Tax=Sporomusa acidovorans (strain ATCC 49682 / DSM 3132 / Mol) TaxID=1123286 RepID=A0ABZ3J2D7_SPOA4|nr:dihydropteroate synthase [Sporomusa acidovorans]OZC20045.1 dihydropteroate synthase [Sporomusa acidovorans DSM 3132]SDD46671.1 dihydropteroate synthase [Sporomusa acidovorans]
MQYNMRVIEIKDQEQARQEIANVNCDAAGIAIMANKVIFKTIKVENVLSKAANLLKQAFLSKGGEAAISRGSADLREEYTDVLLSGSLKQFRQCIPKLKAQPWGLKKLAEELEAVIEAEENFPRRNYKLGSHAVSISPDKTLIMGILNFTPDSFSDGGKFNNLDAALKHTEQMIKDGADIIDIGAESTRPYGSHKISAVEELERLMPVLEKVLGNFNIPVSIDTYKAAVAREALKAGAHIVNDIWGLQFDAEMANVVAEYNAPVVIMYNQGDADYQKDVMSHILEFLRHSIQIGKSAGINPDNFIVDPGVGFVKKMSDNLIIMSRLSELKSLGCPILLGTSRKRFIGHILDDAPADDRVEGTGATVAIGIAKGANIVRVHDVKTMARIARMTDAMLNAKF